MNGAAGKEGQEGKSLTVTNSDGKTVTVPKGDKGDKGDTGAAGKDGKDGATPTITTTPSQDGKSTTVTIEVPGKAPITFTVENGKDGKDGKDGLTPIITATPGVDGKSTVITITIPGKDSTTIIIHDGKDGINGSTNGGNNGSNGGNINSRPSRDLPLVPSDMSNIKQTTVLQPSTTTSVDQATLPNTGTESLSFLMPAALSFLSGLYVANSKKKE